MSQCLRISFSMELPENFLHTFIQKHARSLHLEGTVQVEANSAVKVIVCGKKEDLDSFVDLLHKRAAKDALESIELEPFISDKDFRGVFRVIE